MVALHYGGIYYCARYSILKKMQLQSEPNMDCKHRGISGSSGVSRVLMVLITTAFRSSGLDSRE